MRIRWLLAVGALASLALGVGAFVAGVQITRQSDRLDAAQARAQAASRDASALMALGQDYLLHGGTRAARQWHARHASLAQALQGSPGLPEATDRALAELRETQASLLELFTKLESASANASASVERREMLADHLVTGTQHIADGVYQIAEELSLQRRRSEASRRSLVRTAGVALLAVMIGLALLILLRVLRPLRALRHTALAVQAGDLGARCDDAARDEFGDLARDFNAMTEALQTRSAALHENERKLRVLTERLPALVSFIGPDKRYRYCSAQYERSFGLPAEAIVGRSVAELMGPLAYPAIEPHVEGALAGVPQRFETPISVRGRMVDFLCEYIPERDAAGDVLGFYVMSFDISERRAAERQLVESMAWKRAVLDSAAFGVIAVGVDGLIRSANPAALGMLGYSEDELVGRCTPERFHDPLELTQRAVELSAELGQPVSNLQVLGVKARLGLAEERGWTYIRKDGSRLPVSLTVSAIRDEAGDITGYLALAIDITERKRAEEYIRHLAHHDVLTQLPNRSLLADRLEMAMRRSQRSGDRVAVVMLDLDHFKRINDSLGHPVGDRLLQTVARRLQGAVRTSDTVARMGGDEFVVLLDGIKDGADIERIVATIMQRITETVIEGPHELQVTTSLGVAIYPEDGEDAATLLKNADAAMYDAKAAGRNGYRLFDSKLLNKNSGRLVMEAALRHAIERDELRLHYQPQLDLASGALVGMEALLRWHSAELGAVSPADFIPLAEQCGLILPIGRWVLNQACLDAVQIAQDLGQPLGVAVNVSPLQFTQSDLAEGVRAALQASRLSACQLELEITEGVFLLDAERTLETLGTVRALGVAVAIDDFGTGYSSLAYLTRYPVDRIKIDQSFVRRLPDGANAAAVTNAVISLGHSLGMVVVAEGVETPEQFGYLQDRGCDFGQGFLFGRPMPPQEFVAWAERHAQQGEELTAPS